MTKPSSNLNMGLIAAVDVGSTKVCCAIAQYDPVLEALRVLSLGHHASRGVRNGIIVDMDAIETCILHAVHTAEQALGETLREVLINISGAHLVSEMVDVSVEVSGHEVDEHDVQRILDQSTLKPQVQDFEIIHSLPISYSLDGNHGILDPRGMYGDTLSGKLHVVTAATGPLRNLMTSIKRCHLNVGGICSSAIASGLSTAVQDEKDLGVTVIDMGGEVTNIAIFHEGQAIFTDCIPIGGRYVTSDIARGLSTPMIHAERIKTLFGSAIVIPNDHKEMITVPQVGEDQHTYATQIPKSMLTSIIQPRVEEIFEIIAHRITKSGADKIAGRRFVLTGGASQLPGIRELSSRILNKQVRLGRPIRIHGLSESAGGAAFATCAGLLMYALNEQQMLRAEEMGFFARVSDWFRNNF
jgi:cell division protein FtsA